ncbi:hypothetical protein [Bombiscardovia coagulans]|uniref:Uncharacterized protein n=1 Tax=Bombiscardovia coagulans TaxID=686666 RepID=A0A261ESN6_9BIFI|nr:hypothetical protein [Bombiscardovia coagulans]OZG49872.1 hypothetical protein BOCO_0389 [Bombiscardovia coagulans]
MASKTMKDISDELADGEITLYEAAEQITLVTSMQKLLKQRLDALKEFVTASLDPKEHLTTHTGVVTYKRGAEPKWRVKDPQAFAIWLEEHGESESVEQVLVPAEHVTQPAAIEHLVHQYKGEQPDGVEFAGGTSDTIAISKVKAWSDIFEDQQMVDAAAQMLGIESSAANKEEDEWDKI